LFLYKNQRSEKETGGVSKKKSWGKKKGAPGHEKATGGLFSGTSPKGRTGRKFR